MITVKPAYRQSPMEQNFLALSERWLEETGESMANLGLPQADHNVKVTT